MKIHKWSYGLNCFMVLGFIFLSNLPSRVDKDVTGVYVDYKQLHCLEQVIYHEARGEPIMGQVAVGQVVLNRVNHSRYPTSICQVIYQPSQFSYITGKKYKVSADVKEVALHVYLGLVDDITAGATMYYNPALVQGKPRWDFAKLELVGRLANHVFYKESIL